MNEDKSAEIIDISTPRRRDFQRWRAERKKKQRIKGSEEHQELMAENLRKSIAEQQRQIQAHRDMLSRSLTERPSIATTRNNSAAQAEQSNVVRVDFVNKKRL
jgi:hypothetical protein